MPQLSPTGYRTPASDFLNAKPFPHVVMHDRFEEYDLCELDEAFWRPDGWKQYENGKQAVTDPAILNGLSWFRSMMSPAVLNVLTEMTGIHNLVVDPTFRGAGLHRVEPGGRLGIHVDFNRHPELPLRRVLNTILYLNDPWEDEWNGALELWDENECVVKVQPRRNTFVMFQYSDIAWHGHPHPLACPPGVYRRSAAMYYYVPDDDAGRFHTTVYR